MTNTETVDQSRDPLSWDEWLRLFANRDEVAESYAAALLAEGEKWELWPSFNAAILRRWSPAGLRYVKQRAWRIAEERRAW